MYYRMVPAFAMMLVGCCLIWSLASAFSGSRIGYGGFFPPLFFGPSWSHGGYYHGSYGGGYSGPIGGGYSGSSGRSPVGSYGGGGSFGAHGGK